MQPISELGDELHRARTLVQEAERVVVLTGAGISTDSGIPDFRGPEGLWTKNPEAEKTATLSSYVADPELRKRNWQRLAEGSMWEGKSPNPGHRALVELERQGKLHTLITQNVDGLHRAAGTSEERLVEIHGTTSKVRCLTCGDLNPMASALERVRAGEADPPCLICGGILKSATISFGQNLVMEDLARSEQAAQECDLLLAVGSTLTVYPIANVVPIAHQAGARLVIVNADPTPFDGMATVVLPASISDALPVIVAS
ncbi:SIR2 family NAD-dependent protein deacylase [Candidatus Poriferisocius sp.]|uniref:SIR2 family NAD-dependent protein deacylase n=1 Tax=Candidatus Poriferisocius sp. TaxID=3101276 RepID=UPI003B5AA478